MNKKLRLQLGAVVILAALVYLGIQGAHSFSQYFVPVAQYEQQLSRFSGESLQVQGKLLASSIHYNAAAETMRFDLVSGHYRLPVKYVGVVPTENYTDASAIVEGKMGADGVFQAKQIMIQCPDHYQPVTVTAQSTHAS